MQGKIAQIIGAVVDVRFENTQLPALNTALKIKQEGKSDLVLEVARHMGHGLVRTIAMNSTDGLQRGMEVENTGAPISIPVGPETLGRMFNVIGEPIDNKPAIKGKKLSPIHRDAPAFMEQSTKYEVFETGIKVIDLICPFLKGGKTRLFLLT